MRVISFVGPDSPRLGIVEGDVVVDLTAVDPAAPCDLREVLRAGRLPELGRLARGAAPDARRPLDEVQLGLPVACPGKVFCLGLNYRDHVYEGPFERQEYPAFFMRGATSLVAHGEPIIRSASSVALDYEAELAVIIGRRAHRLREEDCADVIAGYTCFNDGSVRGDVVVMGTPAEVGMARNPPLWMKHGDVVEVEIDAIGTLVNHVQDEPVPALPGARAASAGRSGR